MIYNKKIKYINKNININVISDNRRIKVLQSFQIFRINSRNPEILQTQIEIF